MIKYFQKFFNFNRKRIIKFLLIKLKINKIDKEKVLYKLELSLQMVSVVDLQNL